MAKKGLVDSYSPTKKRTETLHYKNTVRCQRTVYHIKTRLKHPV